MVAPPPTPAELIAFVRAEREKVARKGSIFGWTGDVSLEREYRMFSALLTGLEGPPQEIPAAVRKAAEHYFHEGRCSGHDQFNGRYCRDAADWTRWCIHCAGLMLLSSSPASVAEDRLASIASAFWKSRRSSEDLWIALRAASSSPASVATGAGSDVPGLNPEALLPDAAPSPPESWENFREWVATTLDVFLAPDGLVATPETVDQFAQLLECRAKELAARPLPPSASPPATKGE